MALTSVTAIEKKDNSYSTREQKVTTAVLYSQKTGCPLSSQDMTDLVAILQAVDDYAKGTATGMNTIQTNYNTWAAKPNR